MVLFPYKVQELACFLSPPSGEHLKYVVQMHFAREEATNNTAEYEGLLAAELGIKKLVIRGDSQLVVRQVNKDYQSPLMEAYIKEVRKRREKAHPSRSPPWSCQDPLGTA